MAPNCPRLVGTRAKHTAELLGQQSYGCLSGTRFGPDVTAKSSGLEGSFRNSPLPQRRQAHRTSCPGMLLAEQPAEGSQSSEPASGTRNPIGTEGPRPDHREPSRTATLGRQRCRPAHGQLRLFGAPGAPRGVVSSAPPGATRISRPRSTG